jgi:hypothetical protein
MKLVMTLLVRDEEDVLREQLEFHLARGVDEVILMDNRSQDGTAEIAREYERSGQLRYLFQPGDDYHQSRWVTRMAREAIGERGADWVINSDADEFWWSEGSLKDALAEVPTDALAVRVERTNFVARVPDGEPFWRRMDVRRSVSRNAQGRLLGPKVAHRPVPDLFVENGNHAVLRDGCAVPAVPGPLEILHFPVRSRAQFFRKVAQGGAAFARNSELDPTVGETWRHLYALYRRGQLDEVFAREEHTDEEIAAGLADGTLVRCTRLRDAMGQKPVRA